MQGYEASRPQNFIALPPDSNTKSEQPVQQVREPAGYRLKQQMQPQTTFTQEAESLGIRNRTTTVNEHQNTSWAQLQPRGSEEKVSQTMGTGPTSPRSTANQTPLSQISVRESSTQNQMPAGLQSGGSIFPHTQHKGRRKIGQPFLHTQYGSQTQNTSNQTQGSSGGFLQFQKPGGIFASGGAPPVPSTNSQNQNQRIFSKPHQRNLTSSKEEFKLFHMLPNQTPSHLTQLQPQLQTSQNQHTSTANSSGIDPLCDTSTSGSNTRIGSFKMQNTSNLSSNYQQTQHIMPHVTTTTADSLLAASIDDQFKLIAKGTGSSKFPAAVAFEIAIAKPSVVQNQLRTPGQRKLFQRSSKLSETNATQVTTAVKVSQQASLPQQIQQLNQIKSSGLQVLGMPPNRSVPFTQQIPQIQAQPDSNIQHIGGNQLTAQKSSQFELEPSRLNTGIRVCAATSEKLAFDETQQQTQTTNQQQQLGHNPLFPNHIGYSAAHSQHQDMTPSAHKRKTVIKVPVVGNTKLVNSIPEQNLQLLEEQHREHASVKRATSKKPLMLPSKQQSSANQQVISLMQQANNEFQDLFQIQLIKPQDRTNANSVMQRKLARQKQQKNITNQAPTATATSSMQQTGKGVQLDNSISVTKSVMPVQSLNETQSRNVEKEFVELEQKIKTKESRQHKQLKIIQRQSRAIHLRTDEIDHYFTGNQHRADLGQETDNILNNSLGSSNFSRCSSRQDQQQDSEPDTPLEAVKNSPQDLNISHKNQSNSQPGNIPDSILQSKSSDSSFTRNFNLLLEQSEGLKYQWNEILRNQLSTNNEVYSNFVKKIIEQNRSVFSDNKYFKSMPLNSRKREDFLQQNSFTFEKVVNHIEQAKLMQAGSEPHFRIVHSDQSGQLIKSNSVRQSHASILSPNFSLGAAIEQARAQRLRERRSMLLQNPYSKSQKLINHQNSGNIFQMPDLWHRKGNSLNLTRSNVGISDNNSQFARAGLNQLNIQNSSSGKTPTPQHQTTKSRRSDENQPQPKTLQQLYGFQQQMQIAQQQKRTQLERLFVEQRLENNFLEKKPVQGQQVQGKIIQWVQGKIIGQGITGEVYSAMNINTAEMFVVKKIQLVHPFQGLDQAKVKALKHEIDRFKHLDHQHIVTYYGGEITENNIFCIYLEYMCGGSVADLCKRYGRLGETISRQYTIQVLKALVYLHSKDVIHGDLKGANVLLTKDGERIKLCDLGNSRLLEQEQSWQSIKTVINGTLAWMAPECSESKTGKKSDVWSLGCLLVEMLSGENPWGKRLEDGNIILSLQRALQQKERPEPPKFVSEACRRFVDRCLQHNYKDRPYAHELLEDPWIVGEQKTYPLAH